MLDDSAVLRLTIPFVEKAEIKLKKVGLELIVRVGGHKRNIMLPTALASYRPREARFEDGGLVVRFEKDLVGEDAHEHPAHENAAATG
jgi:arsenite/tail-anchored protein-transporting ATPase